MGGSKFIFLWIIISVLAKAMTGSGCGLIRCPRNRGKGTSVVAMVYRYLSDPRPEVPPPIMPLRALYQRVLVRYAHRAWAYYANQATETLVSLSASAPTIVALRSDRALPH